MFKKIRNSFIKIFDSFQKRRYKKSILYFYDPKIENDRIAQDLDGLTEYVLTTSRAGRITFCATFPSLVNSNNPSEL